MNAETPNRGRQPFVGRDSEFAALANHLDRAQAGQGRVVLVRGEPGVGKTRLVEELAERATVSGCPVLSGRCWDAEIGAPPFWPWTEALTGALGRLDADQLAEIVPGDSHLLARLLPDTPWPPSALPPPQADDPEQGQFRLFRAVTELLRRLATVVPSTESTATADAQSPLLIVLEDLHWADRSSLLLLQFVAREIVMMPVLLERGRAPVSARAGPARCEPHALRLGGSRVFRRARPLLPTSERPAERLAAPHASDRALRASG